MSRFAKFLATAFAKTGPLVSDTFNRADSNTSLGNADTGQAWVALAGTWGISGNAAYSVSGVEYRNAAIDCGVSDGIIKVKFSITSRYQRLDFRVTDKDNLLSVSTETSSYLLRKRVSGSWTALGTYSATPANGDVIEVTLTGSNISVKINGTERLSATESFNQTVTKHGLGYHAGGGGDARWDDFSVEVA